MDATLQNHLKGSLMRAGFHDTAKVTGPPSFRREVVSNCVVAGMRSGFVVRPYCAPQIIERPEAAVPAHNDIEIQLLQEKWKGRVSIQEVLFEFPDMEAPLSWHLTPEEKQAIRDSWANKMKIPRQTVRTFLEGNSGRTEKVVRRSVRTNSLRRCKQARQGENRAGYP